MQAHTYIYTYQITRSHFGSSNQNFPSPSYQITRIHINHGAAHDPARPCAWPCAPSWCGMSCGEPATGVPLLPDSLCPAGAAVPPPTLPSPSNMSYECSTVAHVPRGDILGGGAGSPSRFRLLVRGSMTEAYINDEFLIPAAADSTNCAGASAMAVTGRIGFVQTSAITATTIQVQAWPMTLGDCEGACGAVLAGGLAAAVDPIAQSSPTLPHVAVAAGGAAAKSLVTNSQSS